MTAKRKSPGPRKPRNPPSEGMAEEILGFMTRVVLRAERAGAARELAHTMRLCMDSKAEPVRALAGLLVIRLAKLVDGEVGPPEVRADEMERLAEIGRQVNRRRKVPDFRRRRGA